MERLKASLGPSTPAPAPMEFATCNSYNTAPSTGGQVTFRPTPLSIDTHPEIAEPADDENDGRRDDAAASAPKHIASDTRTMLTTATAESNAKTVSSRFAIFYRQTTSSPSDKVDCRHQLGLLVQSSTTFFGVHVRTLLHDSSTLLLDLE